MKLNDKIIATKGSRVCGIGTILEFRENNKVYIEWTRSYKSSYNLKNIALESIPYKIIKAEIKGLKLIAPKYIKL
jgi:hypothetical protein